jgi:hypothetical protein
MKITKTKLMQVIREELAEARGVEFPRLGAGYSDEDVEYGPPVEDDPYYGVEDDPNERDFGAESAEFEAGYAETMRGLEEELLGALRATGEMSFSPADIAGVAKVAAEFSRGSDEAIYKALIKHFRSKKRMA